jgi:hypothetical protein
MFSDHRTGRPLSTNVRPASAVTSSSATRWEASMTSGLMSTSCWIGLRRLITGTRSSAR